MYILYIKSYIYVVCFTTIWGQLMISKDSTGPNPSYDLLSRNAIPYCLSRSATLVPFLCKPPQPNRVRPY